MTNITLRLTSCRYSGDVGKFAGCETVPSSGPAALVGTVDQLAGHGLDDQSRRYISRCDYKAKGTDLGHLYGFRRHHHSSGNSPVRERSPKIAKALASYKFSRPDANTLAFVLVNDVCKPRIQNVTQPWHSQ